MTKPRYDPLEDVSRHAASDDECCYEMAAKYGWKLKRVDSLAAPPSSIFQVDCVFEGDTEFPPVVSAIHQETTMIETKDRKYIVFMADGRQPGWENRKRVNGNQESFTKVLAEEFDCSGRPIPKPGDRVLELVKVPGFEDPRFPGASTHHRDGDWEVTRVEEYTPEIPVGMAFSTIVLCFCKYNPVPTSLKPLPPIQVSADSFGGDEDAYQTYLETQKEPVAAG